MTRGILGIVKFLFFIVSLPALIAVILGFHHELLTLVGNGESFWWGVIAYVIFHLFVFTPQAFYRFWQSVFMEICSFTGEVANALVIAVPIIPTVLLLISFLAVVIFGQKWNTEYLIFATGFTLALHVILSAQELYETDESQLKGHYLLHITVTGVINIILIAALMDLVFEKFIFMSFAKSALRFGCRMYDHLLSQAGIRW